MMLRRMPGTGYGNGVSLLDDPFSGLLERFWGEGNGGAPTTYAPPLTGWETEAEYVVTADLPGVQESDLNIHIEDGVLTIEGERKSAVPGKTESFFNERPFGRFHRTVNLPEGHDPVKIKAELKSGILTIQIPKKEQAKRRSIKIEVK